MTPAYRNELKFLLDQSECLQLQSVLRPVLARDAHAGPEGGYHIRSLYFDDIYHTAYRQKMAGVEVRKKYRVRIYNCAAGHIALECKYKNGAYIYKDAISLSMEEYQALCRGDCAFLLRRPQPLAHQFFVEARTSIIRPCVIVAYDREAFVNDVGTVRITFDRFLTAMDAREDLFDPAAPRLSCAAPRPDHSGSQVHRHPAGVHSTHLSRPLFCQDVCLQILPLRRPGPAAPALNGAQYRRNHHLCPFKICSKNPFWNCSPPRLTP